MVLLTAENYCQYKTFAPSGETGACPKPPAPSAFMDLLRFGLVDLLNVLF
jgi:hypothetical protein